MFFLKIVSSDMNTEFVSEMFNFFMYILII